MRRTAKLYVGGAFPRTESGRTYLVHGADGVPLANACRASRKDVREAVRAAVEVERRMNFLEVRAPTRAAATDVGEDDFLSAQPRREDEEVGERRRKNHRVNEIEATRGAQGRAREREAAALLEVADRKGLDDEASVGRARG